eukprot:CAMPEP_0114311482 /NCGR_PEP_ID=MMETSP0059-20121206/19847_1 /TAXON_ID=36894 /ORGANISM="Pyramimonas parkeae, Strain CCMP726" /LENGTH=310 /DNA_ID=CAMNT_0001435657 /DNA_START=35 /DNA_END=967 /DNA_ORIENTATION=+
MAPGESWSPDVRKLEVIHVDDGPLGYIYLDLHPRPRKFHHSAQYIIRNWRRPPNGEPQLPHVAIVCNFAKGKHDPPRLQHQDLEALFHEFGHAMHSLLSKNIFQHLAGTRGSMDSVEVPSNLMEYFAWDYRVLKTFAKHATTGEVIPEALVNSICKSRSMFSATDMQAQVVLSMFDQRCHNSTPPSPGGGTTDLMAEIQAAHSVMHHVPGTSHFVRFGHLVNYSANYYSYLFARCIAAATWQSVFNEDPLDRGAGQRLRNDLLQHGGVKPASALQDLLGGAGFESVAGGGHLPAPEPALLEIARYYPRGA